MADQAGTGSAGTGTAGTGSAGTGSAGTGTAGTETAPGARQNEAELSPDAPGTPGNYEPFHGRTVSWVAVSIIVAGFLAGGLSLVFGPTWWLFWSGGAVAVIGALLALSTDIFEDWY